MTATVATAPRLPWQFAAAQRRGHLRAMILVLPLLLFVLVTFAAPVAFLLTRAVYDPSIAQNLPATIEALRSWDGKETPDETAFAALANDFKNVAQDNSAALIGKRLNYEISGVRSKVIAAANKAKEMTGPPYKEQFIALDKMWGDRLIWVKIKQAGRPLTDFYLLRSLDLERNADNSIVPVAKSQAVYINVLARTFYISALVTLITLALAYPVAFMLANAPERLANILLIFILVPFWTSLLVRTTAWFVLLQDNGPVNNLIQFMHLSDGPLKLIFSRFGTVTAMVHIQLPFTLLPIYGVMKGISPSYMRAARSLGGGPIYSFFRVYLPLTLPGIGAGCLLTFILSLGYYITPALVGGASDQMVSGVIASAMNQENNWGKASALSLILLGATLVLFFVYNRIVGIDKVKLG
ncbi:ABC transporter permease [Nordella sp. HKS 07]|uniref:ABC transporter permease n=1 Tax=Nordella sp. HKS 07 TaxID=2712222 RepID=UPI0013E105EA|nr:ABC transporter permease [Nordella sp. HKS 07]QIG48078.1 ABC transporter permease [Nordella sp. HKS 07]